MNTTVVPLAGAFDAATRADWLALVAKTLKGADLETLVSRDADGLTVQPLYRRADSAGTPGLTPAPRGGERPWDIRAAIRHPDVAIARDLIGENLSGGAASVLISIDPRGGCGVALASQDALVRLLDGVLLDLAPVALDAGFLGAAAAGWLAAAAKASPAAPLAFHMDPISAFAAAGASPGPIDAHVARCAEVGARLADPYPKASLFMAGGLVVHEAGGSAASELAFVIAAALTYARALTAAGLTMANAFQRIVLGLAVDQTPLTSIAKLRAARMLWRRMTQACGAETPAIIEARSSVRMLTGADRWSNLVRLTAAGFSGALGGADAVVLGAFSDTTEAADSFASRMARNSQLILMEEAHLGRVGDPAAGAWAFETLSADLARAAWTRFQTIEGLGGVASALAEGTVAAEVADSRDALRAELADGRRRIVGVTDFRAAEPPPDPSPVPAARDSRSAALPGPDSHCPALVAVRLETLAP